MLIVTYPEVLNLSQDLHLFENLAEGTVKADMQGYRIGTAQGRRVVTSCIDDDDLSLFCACIGDLPSAANSSLLRCACMLSTISLMFASMSEQSVRTPESLQARASGKSLE